jgi:uncharacterized membrane protein
LTEGGKPPDERVYEGEPVSDERQERPRGQLVRAEVFYTGPLPNAAEMERYERTLPGAADRIVAMSESEEDHRHRIENRGQILAAALPIFFVILGAVVFLISGSWAGVALAGIGLTPAGYGFLRDVARGRRDSS